MPKEKIYLPVQVGGSSENFQGFERDNTGENIAQKNANYCELTAQYWAWKNRKADVKGLVHYRRYFSNGRTRFFSSADEKLKNVLTAELLDKILSDYDAVLPTKRNYYIETSWSHYKHAHHIEGLEAAREVIREKFPDYLPVFDEVVRRKSVHMFNMLITRSTVFDAYTKWLFEILFEVEKRVDISDYSEYEKRIFGFISEVLLDVWFEKNKVSYKELPVMFIGKQHWIKKITRFLLRKFGLSDKT
ncbi:DUF4422 domain-containing protein [Liquorilactobacillus oeni]|uniref:Capsular biosynthesis protein n=1 Tax=Liquorilactobacillus oeni DSM 19972 TaxID=1423777 RepID=A0A0R1MK56_9LACO|nr:capsular biosynthesis protein [Liquorilactobacillus oeni DSM 19972]